jgi:hypothetical protein
VAEIHIKGTVHFSAFTLELRILHEEKIMSSKTLYLVILHVNMPHINVPLTEKWQLIWFLKSSIFWDKMLCSPLKFSWYFGRTCLTVQGWRIKQVGNQYEWGSKQRNVYAENLDLF